MNRFRKEEGFTLVELMVVVLIIGILVAIAIPVFNAAKAGAQQKSCFANQRTIEGAVQQYVAAPSDPLITTVALLAGDVDAAPLVGVNAFIKEIPRCKLLPTVAYVLDATGSTNCPAGAEPTGHGNYGTNP